MYGLSKIESSHLDFKHPYESTRSKSVGLCPQPIDNAYGSQGVQFLHTSTDIHSSFISTLASSDRRIPCNMKGRAKPSQKNNHRLLEGSGSFAWAIASDEIWKWIGMVEVKMNSIFTFPCCWSSENLRDHYQNGFDWRKQDWYFISKNQPGIGRSDPLRQAKLCWLATLYAPWIFSCSLLAFPLSVSPTSSRLRCLCFSVSISKS